MAYLINNVPHYGNPGGGVVEILELSALSAQFFWRPKTAQWIKSVSQKLHKKWIYATS